MTDYVEIFVARGDKGSSFDSLFDGYLVDYRDPDLHGTANRKLSEHMLRCYQCLIVKRSDFEQKIKVKFGANADKENVKSKADEDAFRSAKGKVDYSALIAEAAKARIDCPELTKIRSADASPVIDCRNLDVSKFIVDTLATGKETGVKDMMLVGSGEYTVGVGGSYETFTLALADGDDVAVGNTLKFTEIFAISDTQYSIYDKKLEGSLIIDGQNYLMENSVDAAVMSILPASGSTGNIIFNEFRPKGTGNLTASRQLLNIAPTTNFTGSIKFNKCKFDGNGRRYHGILINATASLVTFCRSIIANCNDGVNSRYGLILLTNVPNQTIIENCIFDNNYGHISLASAITSLRSTCLLRLGSGLQINAGANSTSTNCATDQAAVGTGTDTNPVVNINVADEFVNTDIDDLTNGYKSKRSGTIYALGTAPTLAENTQDIFGQAIYTPYEIGVGSERVPRITAHPLSQSLRLGETLTLTAHADNDLSVKWQLNGVDIEGATEDTYTKENFSAEDAGTYTAVFSNAVDSVTSNGAVVREWKAAGAKSSMDTRRRGVGSFRNRRGL
jgi:hypothetical protein